MAARKPRTAPGTVATATASGDRRKTLEAIRDELARQLDRCEPVASASIARQLRMTLADLANLPAESRGSKLDEVKARREARRARAVVQE